MSEIKEKINELLLGSTIHSIPNITRSPSICLKTIWILCFLVSISGCTYFLYNTMLNYYNYDFITNIDEISQLNPEFPTVSFCVNSFHLSLSKILLHCKFNGVTCNENIFDTVHEDNETCFRFNYKKPIKTIKSTMPARGLNIALNIHSTYHDSFKTVLFVQNATRVFRKSRSFQIDQGELIPPGFSYIKFYREVTEKLPYPYNDCIDLDSVLVESKIIDYFIKNHKSYSQTDCIDLCVEEKIKEDCNCFNQSIGELGDCFKKIANFSRCLDKKRDLYMNEDEHVHDACSELCKPECKDITYRVTINSVYNLEKFPSFFFDGNQSKENFEKENLVLIAMSYSNLNYKFVNQIPKTNAVDLISNIGGTLGLFIGISFLSFIEILEILLMLFYYGIKSKYQKPKISCK